jgi:ADP-heptose:LPS heptosyltransferase
MSRPARFLFLRGGAIGDFILTLPALRSVRRRWPDAYIELVGYPHVASLALADGLVDRVESLDRAQMATFFSHRPNPIPAQVEHLRSFDALISYLHDPDGLVRGNLERAGARLVLYGSPRVEHGHAVEHFMKPLEGLALYPQGDVPSLTVAGPGCQEARDWLRRQGRRDRIIALHPGSGSAAKNWPVELFIKLARHVERLPGTTAFFVVGEADRAAETALRSRAPELPVLAGTSLLATAQTLACAGGFVGNDSGITHLAAALGLPVVALFGPTDPGVWGPRGPQVRILRSASGRMVDIHLAEVLACLAEICRLP